MPANSDRRSIRLTTDRRAARDHQIRVELARGLDFGTVAERHKLTERQVRNIWKEREQSPLFRGDFDARQELQDELDRLGALMSESAELAETTENDAVRLGTIRTRLAILERGIELKRLYGALPRGREEVELQNEIRELIGSVITILTRHRVPDIVFAELSKLGEEEREQARSELRQPLLPSITK